MILIRNCRDNWYDPQWSISYRVMYIIALVLGSRNGDVEYNFLAADEFLHHRSNGVHAKRKENSVIEVCLSLQASCILEQDIYYWWPRSHRMWNCSKQMFPWRCAIDPLEAMITCRMTKPWSQLGYFLQFYEMLSRSILEENDNLTPWLHSHYMWEAHIELMKQLVPDFTSIYCLVV